jgi:hypothetical protein
MSDVEARSHGDMDTVAGDIDLKPIALLECVGKAPKLFKELGGRVAVLYVALFLSSCRRLLRKLATLCPAETGGQRQRCPAFLDPLLDAVTRRCQHEVLHLCEAAAANMNVVQLALYAAYGQTIGKKQGPAAPKVQEFYAAGGLADMGPVKELVEGLACWCSSR